jgi:FlaA1/EpsC-like NDP-sugar epimerase
MNSKTILDFIKVRSRQSKIKILILNDVILAIVSFFLINYFLPLGLLTYFACSISIMIILSYYFLDIYSNKLKFLSNKWLLQIVNIFLLFILLTYFFSLIYSIQVAPLYYYLFLYLLLVVFSRLTAQSLVYKNAVELKNILIYGAGVSGNKLYNSLKSNSPEYNVVGFIDDDPNKQKERIDSVKIYSPKHIPKLSKQFGCYGIFIAMPSISSEKKKEILINLLDEDLVIKIVPSVKSLVEKTSNFSDMRDINIEDLVNRFAVSPIDRMLKENVQNKTILVTGGGGSIGSELVNQALSLNPKKIVILEMNELNIHNLMLETKNTEKLVAVLGSLLDKPLLNRIFQAHNFDIVFHAAAYKHVPIVEDNIFYGVMNNVYSTFFIGEFSIKYNVENFVLVSTDKAVKPSNYMGKSKLISEMIINQLSKTSKTKFNIVRFGNVLNSSGSVLSIFDQQIKKGGPLTVTDKNVTRYFMSIPEAAQLIIQSSTISDQCRTFILEMGESYNIYDLAKRIIKINGFQLKSKDIDGVEIDIIGLKEGEKLHEELTFNEKDLEETEHSKIYATTEQYFEFDVFEWMKKLNDLYQDNDLEGFKDSLDILVNNHQRIN